MNLELRELARAGVNVESIYILGSKNGKTEVGMHVIEMEKAKAALR